MTKSLLVGGVAALLAASCVSSSDDVVALEDYVAEWAAAWSEGDPYDIVRFYDPDVVVELAQGDNELRYPAGYTQDTTSGAGRAWLADWIGPQTEPHPWRVRAVALDDSSVAVIVAIDDLESAALFELSLGEGGITSQRTLRWRDAHKDTGEPDRRLDWVEPLIGRFLDQWQGTGPPTDPRLLDIETGGRSGPAWFVTPGRETTIVAFLAETAECTIVVTLELEDRAVMSERRLLDPGCRSGAAPWEESLHLPGKLDEEPTITFAGVALYSANEELADFVSWGLRRFDAAGLERPALATVTFAPSRACAGVAGLTLDPADGSRDVVLCTDAYAACEPDRDECSSFSVSSRFALLHELAHVWLLDNVEAGDQEAFLARTDLEAWSDRDVPWHRRGVEHAAETIAWGLMDVALPLTRLGGPGCAQAAGGFEALTGTQPLVGC